VAVGRSADLLLVDGDPLQDLGRLAEPALVMQAGRIVHRPSA
jgi:imidazolonepropionase-like amidohydrolase